jgi:hypothetical protein
MPLIWRLLPTLRIDLPQAAGVVATTLALRRPTVRRWALGGALLGLTILVKETILVLALAPLAFAGTMPRARLVQLWGVFLVAAAVVAGWWWVVVWVNSGEIFPLNAVDVIERRDVGADIRLDPFGVGLLGVVGAAWLVVAAGARRDPGLRLLGVAAACLLPAATYATSNGLSSRNYAGLAVLSAIAIGVAASTVVMWMLSRTPARPRLRAGALGLAAVVGLTGAAAGQIRSGNPGEPDLPGQLVDWLRAETPPGNHVVMTFRYNEIVALELYGDVAVPSLAAVRVDSDVPLSGFLWIGLRDQQLFGYTRSRWEATIRRPGTSYIVFAGPHPLTPAELMPTLDRGGLPGLVPATSFEADGDWATVYGVDGDAVRASPTDVALHLSPAAAIAWLDLASGAPGGDAASASGKLAETGAIVVGPGGASLAQRLVGVGCLVALADLGPDTARIVPIGPACGGG